MLLDAHTMLLRDHIILVVRLRAVLADNLCLFDIDQDFIRKRHMNEAVESPSELLHQLGVFNLVREVNKDHALLCSRSQTQELNGNLLANDCLLISIVNHLCDFAEEWMIEVRVICLFRHVLQQLGHGDDGDTQIDCKPTQKSLLDTWVQQKR